jgi:hypothetical protein
MQARSPMKADGAVGMQVVIAVVAVAFQRQDVVDSR